MSEGESSTRGRPTDYDPSYCDLVGPWGEAGKSKTWMAAQLNVTRQTLDNWTKAHPEFFDAIEKAVAKAQAWWEDAGQNGLTADKFNGQVWNRNMSARFKEDWRETTRHEQTGADGGPIRHEFASLPDEEIDARIARLSASEPAADEG